jgi:PAS domain S-box-containing protein
VLDATMGAIQDPDRGWLRLLDSAPLPILVVQDGVIVYANRATYEVLGYRLDGGALLVGRDFFGLAAPEEREQSRENARRILEGGKPVRNIRRLLLDGRGRRCSTLGSAAPVVWKGKLALEISLVVLRVLEGDLPVGLGPLEQPADRSRGITSLTPRERQIALLVARGHSTADIAAGLGLRVGTIRSHVKSILKKTGTHSRVRLTQLLVGEARL